MTKSSHTPAAEMMAPTNLALLAAVSLDYGPREKLGRFLLQAGRALADRGLTVSLGSFVDLLEANKANAANWLPLLPVWDHRNGGVHAETSFCVLGRDRMGDVVACHAARLFDWSGTTFHDEASSLRLFYADPEASRLPGERCRVTAPKARKITGQVVFSGAAWYRPDFRGRQLASIMPTLGKALAFARWSPDHICSVMQRAIHDLGFAEIFGYTSVEWDVRLTNSTLGGDWSLALVSMDGLHALNLVDRFLADFAQADGRNDRRSRA